jgi:hypothetical protein
MLRAGLGGTVPGRFAWRRVKMGAPVPDDDAQKVPEEVIANAKAAFGRRSEGQLAVLVFDSLLDADAPAADHLLRFAHPLVQVELQVSSGPNGSRLSGRLEPPATPHVQLEFDTAGAPSVREVSGGTFLFERVDHGVIRLNLLTEGSAPFVQTDWFRV